jgi:type II secretory ATPase GspE/PulE/Tfp pilus assembly ATPase PilB-like protein
MVANAAKVRPMKEDGLLKVRQGTTTIDEVVRVTIED